jgi:hypothetical protein
LSLDLTESRSSGQKKAARTASVRAGRPVTQLVVLNLIRSREPCFDLLRHRQLTPQSEFRIPVFWRFSTPQSIFQKIIFKFLDISVDICGPGRRAGHGMLLMRHEKSLGASDEDCGSRARRRRCGSAARRLRPCRANSPKPYQDGTYRRQLSASRRHNGGYLESADS